MTVVRLMGASLVLIVLYAVVFATPEASAASSRADAKFTWGIATGTIYLDKRETAYLSLGAGTVSTFASALPPPANLIVAAAAASLSAYAGKAVVDGRCMKIKISTIPFTPAIRPGTYGPGNTKFGRYCR